MFKYVDLKHRPDQTDLIAEYYVKPAVNFSVRDAAEQVAAESSIGTWTDVTTMRTRIESLAARVFEIKGNHVKIAYPEELFEKGNVPQIMSSIAGNIFGMKVIEKLRLEDIHWPKKLIRSFKGPLFGVSGVRKLVRVYKRPLTGTIIKPKLGLDEKEHAKVAYEAWTGGIDIVKDDENLSNLKFNRFEKRVIETLKMRDKAEKETGERKIYMPNVTGETSVMLKRAEFVKNHGGEYAMVDIITCGWSGLQTLRERNEDLKLVLHAHRAGHAAFTRGRHGVSMIVIAELARLIGVDQIHIGTIIGKMVGDEKEVRHIGEEIEERFVKEDGSGHILSNKWYHIKPTFAVCSGGLHPGLVPMLIKTLGNDIIIQSGGGVHGNPLGTKSGAAAMRHAVDAALKNISLKDYAKDHKELRAALDKWGFRKMD